MHPLVAICLVFLSGLAWMVTVLTLLIVLTRARRRPPAPAEAQKEETPDISDAA
jgi:hypothetical protein